MNNEHAKLVVVSGLSGSGKSIALDALEDAGYNCIDNLPVSLFEALARDMDKAANPARLTAIGIDARAPCHELEKVPRLIRELRAHGTECEIIFLEADTDILMQRFSETRRRHPLTDGSHDLESAIGSFLQGCGLTMTRCFQFGEKLQSVFARHAHVGEDQIQV